MVTTASWGISYVATRWVLPFYDASWIMAVRFLLSSLLMAPLLLANKQALKAAMNLKPVICGAILFAAIYFQIKGLEFTTVAKSSFITALFAFFVPVFTVVFDKRKLSIDFWVLLSCALFGVLLMCDLDIEKLNYGDFLTLICSVLCASHIYIVGKIANDINPIGFVVVQNFVIGILGAIVGLVTTEIPSIEPLMSFNSYDWANVGFAMAVLTLLCTLLAFTSQIYAQKKIPAHIAGLVFLMESPFAAFFGFIILKESISTMAFTGAILIIISVAILPYFSRISIAVQNKLASQSKRPLRNDF